MYKSINGILRGNIIEYKYSLYERVELLQSDNDV